MAFVAVKANSMEPTYDSNNKYNTLNRDIKGTTCYRLVLQSTEECTAHDLGVKMSQDIGAILKKISKLYNSYGASELIYKHQITLFFNYQ
jgi:hypothetical protein